MKSTRKSSELSKVLELGEALIALLEERDISALDLLDSYIEAFGVWEEKELKKQAASAQSRDAKGKIDLGELGQQVAIQHAKVFALAESMKDQVAQSLKSLRLKGKGLKAYSDSFPKRISTTRPRRG